MKTQSFSGTVLLIFGVSCSSVEANPACAAAEQKPCGCADGSTGFQTCNAEGTAFGACACGAGGAGAGAGTTVSTGGDAGGGGGAPCNPGDTVPCYTGPAGTQGVGLCEPGTALCQPDGTPGACMGEVLPAQESCVTPEDEDCDGSSPPCLDLWSIVFTANADFAPDFVETDAAGNVYLAGTFTGTLDLGGGPLTGIGTADIFVAKFEATGTHVWSKRFGQPLDDLFLTGMDVNGAGDVALAGIFYGTLDFGGVPITADPSGPFAAKLDANGNHVWSAAGEGNVAWASPIAFDSQGNATYGVFYGGSVYFGGAEVHMGSGLALAKYSDSGAFVSSAGYAGCSPASYSTGLDAAPNDDIVLLAKAPFNAACDWGGGPVPLGAGLGLARVDADYTHVVSSVFPSVNASAPLFLSTGSNGEIALTAASTGPVDFGGTVVSSSSNSLTGLVAVLEPSGKLRFGKYFEGSSGTGTRLARPRFSSSLGQVAVHGSLVSTTSFEMNELTPIGAEDSLLLHLSTTGAVLTATQYGGIGTTTEGRALAVHPSGSFIVAGRYSGDSPSAEGPDFGQGSLEGGAAVHGYLARVAP